MRGRPKGSKTSDKVKLSRWVTPAQLEYIVAYLEKGDGAELIGSKKIEKADSITFTTGQALAAEIRQECNSMTKDERIAAQAKAMGIITGAQLLDRAGREPLCKSNGKIT